MLSMSKWAFQIRLPIGLQIFLLCKVCSIETVDGFLNKVFCVNLMLSSWTRLSQWKAEVLCPGKCFHSSVQGCWALLVSPTPSWGVLVKYFSYFDSGSPLIYGRFVLWCPVLCTSCASLNLWFMCIIPLSLLLCVATTTFELAFSWINFVKPCHFEGECSSKITSLVVGYIGSLLRNIQLAESLKRDFAEYYHPSRKLTDVL